MPSFAAGLAAFVAYLLALPIALRASRRSPASIAVLLAVAVYVAGLAIAARIAPPLPFWSYTAAYSFPTLCFLMVYGAVYKSISLRMLLELLDAPGRRDEYRSLLVRYVAGASFHDRLEIAVVAGFAMRGPDGYVLTPRGRRLAGAVALMQRAFGITRSG